MFTKKWRVSRRDYDILSEKDVAVTLRDGTKIDCDVYRPKDEKRFPAVLGVHSYNKSWQTTPAMPRGFDLANGSVEAGDYNFYVRRGYAHIIANVRGTGRSGGGFQNYGGQEVEDTAEIISWIAGQPWCDGNVGMFGVSYFAVAQLQVASLNPPNLKAIFAPYGYTDFYRHKYYHGGIFSCAFVSGWAKRVYSRRADKTIEWVSWTREKLGEEKFRAAIAQALRDEEILAQPDLVDALRDPDRGANPLIVDVILNRFDGEYWKERDVRLEDIKIPAYLGADWAIFGLHLPGAFEAWEKIDAPKKMRIGPPIYLDRPVYQYQYESLRWFDYWLKGMDNEIMAEPPIKIFVMGSNEWRSADEWPLPETRWTPFYLHGRGLLSEHEHWPNEDKSSYEDTPFTCHGGLAFYSPPLVEPTEIIGPIPLTLYASTTAEEVLWYASLFDVGPDGEERLLTRGWLRGSQRAVDQGASREWAFHHPHEGREPLAPGQIYEFNINVVPTGNLFMPGHRICLKVRSIDDEHPRHFLDALAQGHLVMQSPSLITIYHSAEFPSRIYLPITKGNEIGTYVSGGILPPHRA